MTFTFISLNLWRGGILLDAILAFLEQAQPDILALQEVWHSEDVSLPARFRSAETIQKRLGFTASKFAPAFIDNEEGHRFLSGNAILTKFKISAHTILPYDKPFTERREHNPTAFSLTPRNLQHAVVQANGIELNVFNTQGVWDLDGDNVSPRRRAMCRTIAEAVKGKQHTILAGDFNLKPTNEALAPVNAELTSVFKNELQTSFNIRRKDLTKLPGYATAVVDLTYVGPDITVLHHSCPDVDISDHLPLVASLKI